MSRSSLIWASSRFNCRISASLPASPETIFANCRFHAYSECVLTPSRYETFATGYPRSVILRYRITLELITEIGLPHQRLLSSFLGAKASRNLGLLSPIERVMCLKNSYGINNLIKSGKPSIKSDMRIFRVRVYPRGLPPLQTISPMTLICEASSALSS